jgi:TolA-binding protein
MMKTITVALVVLSCSSPALAQNKREMQMMADIRMLQEQNQQLQVELHAAIAALNDTLKAINSRVDDQAAAVRKGFADQAVKVDQFASDLRVLREGVSENNVRIGQLSQELEAVRLSIPQYPPSMPAIVAPGDPNAVPATSTPGATGPPAPGATAPQAALPPLPPGTSPQKMFDTAQADYYAGQLELCVRGFEMYLGYFPKSPQADQAQFYVGECHYSRGAWQDAVVAYNQVIGTYPRSPLAADAYYKRGLALEQLGQRDLARESYDGAIKNFPDTSAARLAKQALDRLNRGKPPA